MSCCGKALQCDAKTNLQNEINAVKAKGIQLVMENGKSIWPLTII